MKVLVASDKFKGSLSTVEVAAHVAAGLRAAVPGITVVALPVADGGDGTVAAALSAGFRLAPVSAEGLTGARCDTGLMLELIGCDAGILLERLGPTIARDWLIDAG